MPDTELLSGNSGTTDLTVNMGTVELVNGEHWVRVAFEVGILGTKLDIPPNEARTLIEKLPVMLEEAVTEADRRNAEREKLKATVLAVVEQYNEEK